MALDLRFWKTKRAVDPDLKGIVPWLTSLSPNTKSGSSVTQANSLDFPPILQAVSLKSGLIASFPKEVFRILDDSKTKSKEALWKLLAYKPNSYQNAFTYWELQDVYIELGKCL